VNGRVIDAEGVVEASVDMILPTRLLMSSQHQSFIGRPPTAARDESAAVTAATQRPDTLSNDNVHSIVPSAT